jgi:hypothetical protein
MGSSDLQAWLDSNQWLGHLPSDLLNFWQETGGGDAFESETVLGPLSDPNLGDDIALVNREFRSRGMPERVVVYHTGLLMSAVDTTIGDYVELEPSVFEYSGDSSPSMTGTALLCGRNINSGMVYDD